MQEQDAFILINLRPPTDMLNAALDENRNLKEALAVPRVWSDEEREGMVHAFAKAQERHGHAETLFAVAAWLLRYRAAKA